MLGSMKKCSNCHGTEFQRIKINRTVQCENCKLILEERCMSDLMEFHAVTQTEEVYCVVTPDFLHNHLVDDIPNDPYCTPGFISAFRMLSPLREPVYAASSRTLNGALAEMERLIGDALFAGYVGYNGRAPGGSAVKKEEPVDSSEKIKSGGDARHTLVAYFEIVELASILCVDKETTNLAIRIFRHTASNTSLRNRNVESLATAAFVSAVDRRWHEYQQWLKEQKDVPKPETFPTGSNPDSATSPSAKSPWPVAPRRLSVEEISAAANLDTSEVLRYLKVVNIALRKQRSESNSSTTEHMPSFCRKLEIPERTQNLAIAIAENAMRKNICSRRNPGSVAAAAIYLACQLDGVRRTQTEICRVSPLTEVTLRKVRNELNAERDALLPEWYQTEKKENGGAPSVITPRASMAEKRTNEQADHNNEDNIDSANAKPELQSTVPDPQHEVTPNSLVPPPLPPGFGEKQKKGEPGAQEPKNSAVSPIVQGTEESQKAPNPVNQLLAMANNPAMQVFANAFSMMPQFMMPPPPPPLPPSIETTKAKERDKSTTSDPPDKNSESKSGDKNADDATNKDQELPVASKQPPTDIMAGVQSMMGMMQAMQAFQTMQPSTSNGNSGSTAQNPWTMMANALAQTNILAQTQQGTATTAETSSPDCPRKPPSGEGDKVTASAKIATSRDSNEKNEKNDSTKPES